MEHVKSGHTHPIVCLDAGHSGDYNRSPAVPEYYLNTPLFKEAQIRLNPTYHSCKISEQFEIECDKDPLEYLYIKEAYLNDQKIERQYLTYEEITAGGKLKLILSKEGE